MAWIKITSEGCSHSEMPKPRKWKKFPEGSIWECDNCGDRFIRASYRGYDQFIPVNG